MKVILIVTKEDINTTLCGLNYVVTAENGMILNFTKEAIEELHKDMIAADGDFKEKHEGKTQQEFYHPEETK